MNLNRKIWSLVIVFLLLFACFAIAVAAEEESFEITYIPPTGATVTLDPEGVPDTSGTLHKHLFIKGTEVTVTITANAGYELESIYANGANLQGVNGQTTYSKEFSTNTSLVISTKVKPAETAYIAVNDDQNFSYILEGADSENKATIGSSVTLKITPDEGFAVSGIKLNGTEVGASNSHTFTVGQTNEFVVTVAPVKALLVSVTGIGTVSPSSGNFAVGSPVTLTFTPGTGYALSTLVINDYAVPLSQVSGNKYTFTLTQDTDISVVFTKSITITATIGNGGNVMVNGTQVSGTSTVKVSEGSDVIIKVNPSLGYVISSVRVANVAVTLNSENSYTISNITANTVLSVSFTASSTVKQHIISASAGDNGIISPSGSVTVEEGKDITFTITPDNGYEIDTVKVDGVVVALTGGQYKFTNVGASQNIYATFKKVVYSGDDTPISVDDINWNSPNTITIDISKKTKVSAEVFRKITEECQDKTVIFAANSYKWLIPKGSDVTISSDFADLAVIMDGGPRYNEIKNLINEKLEELNYTLISYGNSFTFPEGSRLMVKLSERYYDQKVQQLVYLPDEQRLSSPINSAGNEVYDERLVTDEGWVTFIYYNNADVVLCDVLGASFTIVASASHGGTINPFGNKQVAVGGSIRFNIEADEGFVINSLIVDGVEVTGAGGETSITYPFDMVAMDHSISVTFVLRENYKPPVADAPSNNSGLIVSLIIVFLAIAGAAVLFIIKWRQEKY